MMKHKKVVLHAIMAGMCMAMLPVPAVFASEATVEEALRQRSGSRPVIQTRSRRMKGISSRSHSPDPRVK